MAEVTINLEKMTAKVVPEVHEKYARKLVQDKLKAETDFKGGWYVWSRNNPSKDGFHLFNLTNGYYLMSKLLTEGKLNG